MLILSLDSAGSGCNLCVWRDGQILSLIEQPMERGQDRQLVPLTISALQEAHVEFDELDRIAATRGPGSFTGLRIGLAAAQGFGLALSKPVIGIDRFSIYREQFRETAPLLIVIQSKREELYCRFYPVEGEAGEPVMMTPDEIRAFVGEHRDIRIVGDATIYFSHMESGREWRKISPPLAGREIFHNAAPSCAGGIENIIAATEAEAVTCARLAAAAEIGNPGYAPHPLYIRAPDVTIKPPVIRLVTPEDAETLAQLHRDSFPEGAWTLEQMKGSLALPTTQGWIATQNNEPAGFILCQATPQQWEILTVCVHPSHQRRGIGERLLREALRATSATHSNLFLDVAADNLAALGLYAKCGFAQNGLRKGYYRRKDGNVDAVLLATQT